MLGSQRKRCDRRAGVTHAQNAAQGLGQRFSKYRVWTRGARVTQESNFYSKCTFSDVLTDVLH